MHLEYKYKESLSPKKIWNLKQNKPSLIASDLKEFGVPANIVYAVLLARGVFKWLAVRRDLIKLKNEWRDALTNMYSEAGAFRGKKGSPRHQRLVGKIEAIEMCRKQIRKLCHSDRFRAPDFDQDARRYLTALLKEV